MARPSIKTQRRQELIQATIATIREDGLDGASLARIAKRAGLSAGIVAHYFGDKAELLEATLRHLGRDLGTVTASRLRTAKDPEARLRAIIASNLDPRQFHDDTIAVWLAFWSQVNHSPRLARIQRVISRRLISNLRGPLRQLVADPAEASRIALGLSVMIDGIWLRAALRDSGLPADPDQTRRLAEDYLAAQLQQARPE